MKKMLLALAVLGALAVAAAAAFLAWNGSRAAGAGAGVEGEEQALSRVLDEAFGGQPTVEFVCSLPVVGVAPCVLGDDVGTREVRLSFTAYPLPEGDDAGVLARRVATLAMDNSLFARESDRTEVIFEDLEGSSSALVSMKYSFLAEQLKVGQPGPDSDP